jgi:flagellar protein FlgJ
MVLPIWHQFSTLPSQHNTLQGKFVCDTLKKESIPTGSSMTTGIRFSTDAAKSTSKSNAELNKLKKATEDFEQIFVSMMLKEMYKSIGKTGFLDNGSYEKMFKEMMIDERAKQLVESGELGFSKMMYEQLKQHVNSSDNSTDTSDLKKMAHSSAIEQVARDWQRTKDKS